MPMRRMTPEEEAQFEKEHPFRPTIIFGVKPPKWWQEKYGNVSKKVAQKNEQTKEKKK